MKKRFAALFAACAVVLMTACSSSSETTQEGSATSTETAAEAETGPQVEDTVKAFYDHLNAGHQTEALALYTDANRTAMADPSSGFGDWAKSETKEGTIQSVEVEPVSPTGATVTVPFTLVYKDGTRAQRAVEAYRIGGTWMLGSVTER